MAIQYTVDDVQHFRGFLLIEGWAFDPVGEVETSFAWKGETIAGLLDRTERPDVVAALAGAPLTCGFRLRAVLPEGVPAQEIALHLRSEADEHIIDQPGLKAATEAYAPLEKLSARFFDAVRSSHGATVLELGARARSGITRRELFGDAVRYVGLDILPGENVDIVGDAHRLTDHFSPNSVDFAYSVSVFEHLMWPWKVAIELGTVMRPGGLALIQSHALWPKHEMPWDFFRFWDSGWRGLFCSATGFRVVETVEAHGVEVVARFYTGSPVFNWHGYQGALASAVLVEKIREPQVRWDALPPLDLVGHYPH